MFCLAFHCGFLPRDAIHKRGLCCRPVSVPLSVRPSITLVDCIHTAEDIVKILPRPSSPIILDFSTPSADTQFQGKSLRRGHKIRAYKGVGKFCNFRLKSLSISETVRDRPIVAM